MKFAMAIEKKRIPGRSPCGERGLKSARYQRAIIRRISRSPCGERGLKSPGRARGRRGCGVAPRAGSVG